MDLPRGQVVAVGANVKRKDGSILIFKRNLTDTTPGIWEHPGGKLEWGEDPAEGAKREVKEETNLDVKITRPIDIYSYVAERHGQNKHCIQLVFEAELLDENQEVVINDEHSEFRWVKLEELKGMYVSFFFRRLLEGKAKL